MPHLIWSRFVEIHWSLHAGNVYASLYNLKNFSCCLVPSYAPSHLSATSGFSFSSKKVLFFFLRQRISKKWHSVSSTHTHTYNSGKNVFRSRYIFSVFCFRISWTNAEKMLGYPSRRSQLNGKKTRGECHIYREERAGILFFIFFRWYGSHKNTFFPMDNEGKKGQRNFRLPFFFFCFSCLQNAKV